MTPPIAEQANGPTPLPFRVAAIQFEPKLFAKEANLAALLALTEEAAAGGAKLIVTPEMATTAYCWASRDEVAADVESVPGPTTERFGEIAALHGCWIVVGLPEVDAETGVFYNSAVLIGPEGPVGRYRKTHAYIAEPKWAKDGDLGLPVFETPLGRIAITICMDACYPETSRIPALAGADVVCFPTNWLSEKSPSPSWMARAAESGVYFIAANRYGVERGVQFSGGSAVIDPDGQVQSALDTGDGLVWGWVDPARARDKRPLAGRPEDLIADRRPDAYGSITLNSYLWNPAKFHGLYGIDPLPEGKRSRVAVVQFSPRAGDVAENLARITREAEALAGTKLIVFPELSVSGPVADAESAERLAELVPGPSTARLQEIATNIDAWLVAGLIERGEDGKLCNSAILVGPDGVAGTYRKLHLAAEDRPWAAPGDRGLPVFDIPAGRVGMLIGYDVLFPEAARPGARRGGYHRLPLARHLASGPPLGRDRGALPRVHRGRPDRRSLSPLARAGAGEPRPRPLRQWRGALDGVERLLRGRAGERAARRGAGAAGRRGRGDARDRHQRRDAHQGPARDAHAALV